MVIVKPLSFDEVLILTLSPNHSMRRKVVNHAAWPVAPGVLVDGSQVDTWAIFKHAYGDPGRHAYDTGAALDELVVSGVEGVSHLVNPFETQGTRPMFPYAFPARNLASFLARQHFKGICEKSGRCRALGGFICRKWNAAATAAGKPEKRVLSVHLLYLICPYIFAAKDLLL